MRSLRIAFVIWLVLTSSFVFVAHYCDMKETFGYKCAAQCPPAKNAVWLRGSIR